jgi:hypothetical protein
VRESLVEAYLVQQAKKLGGEVRKVKWIGRNGAPDRLVMLPPLGTPETPSRSADWDRAPGWLVWVELKATGKKAEPHQLREHKRMLKMGQRVLVIDSFEGVDELLHWTNAGSNGAEGVRS